MAKAAITIDCGNAAFHEPEDGGLCAGFELARILREIADRIEYEGEPDEFPLHDINGNKVGMFEFEED